MAVARSLPAGGDPEKFKEINEAYEVLSDSEKRLKYDQIGANAQAGEDFRPPPGWANGRADSQNGNSGFGGDSDFFESLFGGRRSARGGATFRMAGRDINATISLALEEAHGGVVHNF